MCPKGEWPLGRRCSSASGCCWARQDGALEVGFPSGRRGRGRWKPEPFAPDVPRCAARGRGGTLCGDKRSEGPSLSAKAGNDAAVLGCAARKGAPGTCSAFAVAINVKSRLINPARDARGRQKDGRGNGDASAQKTGPRETARRKDGGQRRGEATAKGRNGRAAMVPAADGGRAATANAMTPVAGKSGMAVIAAARAGTATVEAPHVATAMATGARARLAVQGYKGKGSSQHRGGGEGYRGGSAPHRDNQGCCQDVGSGPASRWVPRWRQAASGPGAACAALLAGSMALTSRNALTTGPSVAASTNRRERAIPERMPLSMGLVALSRPSRPGL